MLGGQRAGGVTVLSHIGWRLLLMVIVALGGLKLGYLLVHSSIRSTTANAGLFYVALTLIGAVVGFVGAPYVSPRRNGCVVSGGICPIFIQSFGGRITRS